MKSKKRFEISESEGMIESYRIRLLKSILI
jgi:hypothetical protein